MLIYSIIVLLITAVVVYLFFSILKSVYHPIVPQTLARRIHSDECCICLENVRYETQASCGHIFCGDCILALWNRTRNDAVLCPLCRNPISILFPNFKDQVSSDDSEANSVLENIDRYNVEHSTDISSVTHYARFYRSYLKRLFYYTKCCQTCLACKMHLGRLSCCSSYSLV